MLIKNEAGMSVNETEIILERVRNYYKELVNQVEGTTEDVEDVNDAKIEARTKEKLFRLINNLKNNESSAEMMKTGGQQLHEWIYERIKRIWKKNESQTVGQK